jgi:hypothetical protein
VLLSLLSFSVFSSFLPCSLVFLSLSVFLPSCYLLTVFFRLFGPYFFFSLFFSFFFSLSPASGPYRISLTCVMLSFSPEDTAPQRFLGLFHLPFCHE